MDFYEVYMSSACLSEKDTDVFKVYEGGETQKLLFCSVAGGGCPVLPGPSEAAVWKSATGLQ